MKTEAKRALAILNEAKNQDVITGELPESEDKRIKLANVIVEKARKAYSNGEKGNQVTRILFAADVDIGASLSSGVKDKDEELYRDAISEKLESGIPIPHELEGDVPELPLDFTDISDKQVSYLHGAFNACSARTGWLYAIEEAGESAAKKIADYHEEEYIINKADRKDHGGKAKAAALLKAEARQYDPDIEKWRKREHEHSIAANKYKRLLNIFDNNCERLSREWTFRIQEREGNK